MEKGMKRIKTKILKAAIQLVYQCAESTPPEVKSSDHNIKVAKAVLRIEEVIKSLKQL